MNSAVVTPARMDIAAKYQVVADLIARSGHESVLDVGCRNCVLRPYIERSVGPGIWYVGLDLDQNDEGTVGLMSNVAVGIPVQDGGFDAVIGLDILEHLDDLQRGLEELIRVARRQVMIVLPNLAHIVHRTRFAFTGRLSGKYDLGLDAGIDRHRWLTVVPQIDDFVAAYAQEKGLGVVSEDLSAGPRTRYLEHLLRIFHFDRSWHAWAVLYTLTKPS